MRADGKPRIVRPLAPGRQRIGLPAWDGRATRQHRQVICCPAAVSCRWRDRWCGRRDSPRKGGMVTSGSEERVVVRERADRVGDFALRRARSSTRPDRADHLLGERHRQCEEGPMPDAEAAACRARMSWSARCRGWRASPAADDRAPGGRRRGRRGRGRRDAWPSYSIRQPSRWPCCACRGAYYRRSCTAASPARQVGDTRRSARQAPATACRTLVSA